MKTYKAPDNSLHVIEPEFAHLLPEGSVPISEKQAKSIRAKNAPKPDLKAEAQAYLRDTDWYVTRLMETGKEIPADVAEARAKARETLKD